MYGMWNGNLDWFWLCIKIKGNGEKIGWKRKRILIKEWYDNLYGSWFVYLDG